MHVYSFESQGTSTEKLRAHVRTAGVKYPVSKGGGTSFKIARMLPAMWVIGVDSKALWYGNPLTDPPALEDLIKKETSKIRFPGLGRLSVDPSIAGAASHFIKGQLGSARIVANGIIEKSGLTATQINAVGESVKSLWTKPGEKGGKSREVKLTKALRDAAFVVKRVNDEYARLLKEQQDTETAWDFLESEAILKKVVLSFGAKTEEGKWASEKLEEWKENKELQAEISAQKELAALLIRLDAHTKEVRNSALDAFAKRFPETRAAQKAVAEKYE